MSQTVSSFKQLSDTGVARVNLKFEVALAPVADVDRAKEFYTKLGWRLDDDLVVGSDFRVVQLTPPGSASSISFGKGVTDAKPGSFRGGLIVSASRRVKCSTARRSRRQDASAAQTPSARATAPTSPSKIPMATRGLCRRSRTGHQAALIQRRRPLHQQAIWQEQCGAPQPRTANMKRSTGRATRTGRTARRTPCHGYARVVRSEFDCATLVSRSVGPASWPRTPSHARQAGACLDGAGACTSQRDVSSFVRPQFRTCARPVADAVPHRLAVNAGSRQFKSHDLCCA